ncbi:MAG: DNA/RNA nuclease SfsA [Candidatus Thermoplasmatota archaeon]|nr:DNA/RNA nuclease SfsA [Candidatus Thermoplasmatota archaeon]
MESLLQFEHVLSCTIVERVNRFVVAVDMDGERQRAWINNTGRLEAFVQPGTAAYCLPKEGGKTDARLFAIADGGAAALIDTRFQMDAFEHAVRRQLLSWLHDCSIVRRDAPLGDSRIDYLLSCIGEPCYLEVKSAVLRSGRTALYPDCPSTRGQRHVAELIDHARRGGTSALLFAAGLPGVSSFRPNRMADERLAGLIVAAADAGVAVHAVGLCYLPEGRAVVLFDDDVPVLPPVGHDSQG